MDFMESDSRKITLSHSGGDILAYTPNIFATSNITPHLLLYFPFFKGNENLIKVLFDDLYPFRHFIRDYKPHSHSENGRASTTS